MAEGILQDINRIVRRWRQRRALGIYEPFPTEQVRSLYTAWLDTERRNRLAEKDLDFRERAYAGSAWQTEQERMRRAGLQEKAMRQAKSQGYANLAAQGLGLGLTSVIAYPQIEKGLQGLGLLETPYAGETGTSTSLATIYGAGGPHSAAREATTLGVPDTPAIGGWDPGVSVGLDDPYALLSSTPAPEALPAGAPGVPAPTREALPAATPGVPSATPTPVTSGVSPVWSGAGLPPYTATRTAPSLIPGTELTAVSRIGTPAPAGAYATGLGAEYAATEAPAAVAGAVPAGALPAAEGAGTGILSSLAPSSLGAGVGSLIGRFLPIGKGSDTERGRTIGGGALGGGLTGLAVGGPIGGLVGLGLGAGLGTLSAYGDEVTDAVSGWAEEAGDFISDPCIIVTTCTDPRSAEVNVTREYRDKFLDEETLRGYYMLAEHIVPFLEENEDLRVMMKKNLVDPLIEVGRYRLGKTDEEPSETAVLIADKFLENCKAKGQSVEQFQRSNGEIV